MNVLSSSFVILMDLKSVCTAFSSGLHEAAQRHERLWFVVGRSDVSKH